MPICSPTKELVSSSTFDLPSGEHIPTFERFVLQGSPFVRLAGLSGAAAVALGAYGAHCKNIPYLLMSNAKSFLELIKVFLTFQPFHQRSKK